jgi:hypothetical protein
MRIRTDTNPVGRPGGRVTPEFVPACAWPRDTYRHGGNTHGGGSSIRQRKADIEEMRSYLVSHPGATLFDIEMELHLTEGHARRLLQEAKK